MSAGKREALIREMYADAATHYRVHKLTGPPSRLARDLTAYGAPIPLAAAPSTGLLELPSSPSAAASASASGGAAASSPSASSAAALLLQQPDMAAILGDPVDTARAALGGRKRTAEDDLLDSDPVIASNGLRENFYAALLEGGVIPASAYDDDASASGAGDGDGDGEDCGGGAAAGSSGSRASRSCQHRSSVAAAAERGEDEADTGSDDNDPWHLPNGTPYDLRITVQGRHVFKCHRVVVCRRSQYLAAMANFQAQQKQAGAGAVSGSDAFSSLFPSSSSSSSVAASTSTFDALAASLDKASAGGAAASSALAGGAAAGTVLARATSSGSTGPSSGSPFFSPCSTGTLSLSLDEVSPLVFALMLEYMYCDAMRPIPSPDIALEALQAADLFVVTDGLKPLVVSQAIRHINDGTVVSFLRVADLYNLQRLLDACARYVALRLSFFLAPENIEFAGLVTESAASIKRREETDSIPVLDAILSAVKALFGDSEEDEVALRAVKGERYEACMQGLRGFALRLGLKTTSIPL